MTPSSAPELDRPTVLHALAGHDPALARLYAAYHPLVLRVAQRAIDRLHLPDAPCELASEVWVRLLDRERRVLRAFDPARGSFRGFMRMVAWQHAYEVARRWQRRALHEAPFSCAAPDEPLAPCATSALHRRWFLHRVVDALPRLEPLDLTLLEDALRWQTPAHELAPRLGCTTHALHKRRERLHRRLRNAAWQLEAPPSSTAPPDAEPVHTAA